MSNDTPEPSPAEKARILATKAQKINRKNLLANARQIGEEIYKNLLKEIMAEAACEKLKTVLSTTIIASDVTASELARIKLETVETLLRRDGFVVTRIVPSKKDDHIQLSVCWADGNKNPESTVPLNEDPGR